MVAKLVGVRIKELRSDLGMSQVSFAGKIGMARTYFAEVETGKRNVSMRNLLKITNGLGVTLAEFFDSDEFAALYSARELSETPQHAGSASVPPAEHPSDTQSQ